MLTGRHRVKPLRVNFVTCKCINQHCLFIILLILGVEKIFEKYGATEKIDTSFEMDD